MNIEQALHEAPLCRQLTKVKALWADLVSAQTMMIINPDASIAETGVMLASFAEAALLSFGLLLFYRRDRRRHHIRAPRSFLEVIGEKDAKPLSPWFQAAAQS